MFIFFRSEGCDNELANFGYNRDKKKAKKKWKKLLEESTLDEIFTLTQQHPYYLNVLCHRLWSQKERPNVATVLSSWEQYVLEEKSQIMAELELLSANQAKMLLALMACKKIS